MTAICFALPAALYLWLIAQYGANVIWGDQWADVNVIKHSFSGTLTLSTLWAQHNEERNLFSNLLVVLLARTTHFNLFVEMYASAAILFLAIWLVIATHKARTPPETRWIYYCPMALVLLSFVQYGDTLWGFQVAWYIVLASLAAAMWFLDRRALTPLLLTGAIVAGVVGSFSLFQGLLIWPTGLVLLYHRRRRIGAFAVWVGSGVLSTIVYFHNFNSKAVASTSNVPFVLHHPFSALDFFFTATGDVIGVNIPVGGDLGVALLGIVIFAIAIWAIVRHGLRPDDKGPRPIGIALILFGLLYALSFTLGRTAFGISFAGMSTYRVYTLLILVGSYLALVDPVSQRADRRANVGASQRPAPRAPSAEPLVRGLLLAVIATQVVVGFFTGLSGARSHQSTMYATQNVVLNIDKAPDSAVYDTYLVGPPDFVRKSVKVLEKYKLTFFATSTPMEERDKEGLLIGPWAGELSSPVSPWQHVEDGEALRVEAKDLPAGSSNGLDIAECNPRVLVGDQRACTDPVTQGTVRDSAGTEVASYRVTAGKIGDGTCDAGQTCYIAAWRPGTYLEDGYAEIDFAGTPGPSSHGRG